VNEHPPRAEEEPVPGVLAYNPQRLATLVTFTRTAADELSLVTEDEPLCEAACKLAGNIAAGLDGQLRDSLSVLLLDRAMIDEITVELMSIDEITAALVQPVTDPNAPFVLDGSQFSLADAIETGGNWREDVFGVACVGFTGGNYVGGGYVTDLEGTRYPIVIPHVETDEGHVYTADEYSPAPGEPSVATLGGSDPGWGVVGCVTGVARFQEAPSLDEGLWGFLAGTTGVVQPLPPNSGLAQIAMSVNGPPHLVDDVARPEPVVATQSGSAPDPFDTSPGAVLQAGASLGVTVAQGGVMAAAMDNQSQRGYQVIFEENADGRRRARIQTFTLAHDGEGEVVIVPEHVFVDANGDLISETISYGSPYDTSGLPVASFTDDVAEFVFSGDEPIRYTVPRAVFP
jgi:hypothetical protein